MASRNQYRELFLASPQPMWIRERRTLRILEVNDAAIAMYGYTRDEFLALRVTDISAAGRRSAGGETAPRSGRRTRQADGLARHRRKNGHELDVEVTSRPLTYEGRDAVLVAVRDVTFERALDERFRHYSLRDSRTGLGNRSQLVLDSAALQRAWQQPVALLMIEIHGLRTVNVELGRDAGDEVIIAVGSTLRILFGEEAPLFHLAGQTFAAFVEGDEAQARQHANRVLSAMRQPYVAAGTEAFVSAHVGIAIGEPGWDAGELLRLADAAVQSAKVSGSRVAVFNTDPHVLRHVLRSRGFTLESALLHAVQENQLRTVYQPILDVAAGTIAGVEALVRWQHPQVGLLLPGEFIPHAERAGVIFDIDSWVLSESCRQIAAWRTAGITPRPVSVNLSARDLDGALDIADHIRRELERYGVDASLLAVELTETTALHNREAVERLLDDLRAMGVAVALDDFGTGYSMLDRIRDLRVDRIKIDRTFIRRALNGGGPLVTAVITMAHDLHLEVVAEGVERDEELAMLRAHGCDFAQGYLIGEPMPADDRRLWADRMSRRKGSRKR
ncbi:MAG: EAL domain-containing protein [Candidatus Dormibacteraeota bacterium]|nr:EAL domain-containing protein [Candidatus Dormibacteraeota bacterium]